MHLVWTLCDGQFGRNAHIPSHFSQPPMGVEFLTFQSFYCLLFLLKFAFPLVICVISHFFSCCVDFPRAPHYAERSLRPVTSVTHASGVFTWWKEFVQRGSTSTGSVSAAPPAAVRCAREDMPLTQNTVCAMIHMTENVPYSADYFVLRPPLILQENCTANFTSISSTTGRTYAGTCRSAS